MRTAADDVGAGNAGLRLLTEVDFDMMKIDLSLVRAGAATGTSDAVLRALRDLAERRGQTIVAEGVETLEQLEVVIGLGFDSAQGYLLGRPSPDIDALDVDLGTSCRGRRRSAGVRGGRTAGRARPRPDGSRRADRRRAASRPRSAGLAQAGARSRPSPGG